MSIYSILNTSVFLDQPGLIIVPSINFFHWGKFSFKLTKKIFFFQFPVFGSTIWKKRNNFAFGCVLVFFHTNLETTNSHRNRLSDISYKIYFSRDCNEIKNFENFFCVEKNGLKFLVFGLISSKQGEQAGWFFISTKKFTLNNHWNRSSDIFKAL